MLINSEIILPVTMGNVAFQALSLVVAGLFCHMLYTFRVQAVECLGSVVKFSSRDEVGTENKRMYDNFLGVAMFTGALAAGVGVIKLTAAMLATGTGTPGSVGWRVADLAGTAGIGGMPVWVVPAAAIAVSIVATLVVLAGVWVLKAAGGLTLSEKFTDEVVRMKKNWLAAGSVLMVPLVAIWTGANPIRDTIVAYLIAAVFVMLCGFFVAHTFKSFVGQKISVLVWFLYLCTVEIFPVCAVVLAVTSSL